MGAGAGTGARAVGNGVSDPLSEVSTYPRFSTDGKCSKDKISITNPLSDITGNHQRHLRTVDRSQRTFGKVACTV